MKTKFCRVLAILLVLVCLCPAASARISGVNLMSVRMAENEPVMYVELRAMDSTGEAAKSQYVKVNLYGAEERIELMPEPMGAEASGHIIVVDTSVYYHTSGKVKTDDVRSIVSEYLSRVSGEERVMFILAGEGEPKVEDYMSASDAKSYVNSIEFGKQASACINTAVYQAFQHAVSPEKDAPMFNAVFIVADPDIRSNTGDRNTLDEAAGLRSVADLAFDVAVAVPRREEYLTGAPEERRRAVEEGLDRYRAFCSKVGGKYIPVAQDNKGIEARDLHEALTGWSDTTLRYKVDYSALAGYVPVDDGVQEVPLTVSCSDTNGPVEITRNITINPELLPERNWTPAPEPTPDGPTPTPAPTPVVRLDQKDEKAIRVIHELNKQGYLPKTGYSSFNSECMSAYYTFCEVNDIVPRDDGIYEGEYDLILSGNYPMPTPEPTATPKPEVTMPPKGFRINDQDTGDSLFIGQMQTVLQELNCYLPGAAATPGRFDQATLDAVNRFCEGYNYRNDYPANGVDQKLAERIIDSEDLPPLPDPKPSLPDIIREFLNRDLNIGSLSLKMWIPVAVCGGLLFLIIVLVVLLSGHKEKKIDLPDPVPAPAPAPVPAPGGGASAGGYAPSEGEPNATVIPWGTITLYLTIEYKGNTRTETIEVGERPGCTIGRKDCQILLDAADKSLSRCHAELYYKNGQVYVRDRSSFHNTMVNGFNVRTDEKGTVVSNGDQLKLSEHTITIHW